MSNIKNKFSEVKYETGDQEISEVKLPLSYNKNIINKNYRPNEKSHVPQNISWESEIAKNIVYEDLNLQKYYNKCKEIVIQAGYRDEIEWQSSVNVERLTESYFLREHAWVTLASGMKEIVIRNLFEKFSKVFFDWRSAELIIEHENSCRDFALEIFGNKNKIDAIVMTSRIILIYGFEVVKEMILRDPVKTLRNFPYIGPITYFHLAKNIGLQVAKPDRHLTRLAKMLNFPDAQRLCEYLSRKTGDSIPVIDIVLWRYATITVNYESMFIHLLD